jgi:hypothetical protein
MQRNKKSNCGRQHHNHKLFITQKSQLMSICLRLKHKLYIQKNGYIYVLQVTLAIYKIYKNGPPSSTPLRLKDVLNRSTPHSVQQNHPSHHQYLHPKKLNLYNCGDSHIRVGESVSSPPQ